MTEGELSSYLLCTEGHEHDWGGDRAGLGEVRGSGAGQECVAGESVKVGYQEVRRSLGVHWCGSETIAVPINFRSR